MVEYLTPAHTDDWPPGFTAFQFATFPEYAVLFQSYVDWHENARRGLTRRGRHILTVEVAESFVERALESAESTARALVGAEGLDLGEIDLLVATASVRGFADALAARLGLPAERAASAADGLAGAHTAAPAVALETLRLEAAGPTLFVSAGAGITVAAAVYRG
jgi:3-oxoacyl-[acyl-carrier-protein] synthase III